MTSSGRLFDSEKIYIYYSGNKCNTFAKEKKESQHKVEIHPFYFINAY